MRWPHRGRRAEVLGNDDAGARQCAALGDSTDGEENVLGKLSFMAEDGQKVKGNGKYRNPGHDARGDVGVFETTGLGSDRALEPIAMTAE